MMAFSPDGTGPSRPSTVRAPARRADESTTSYLRRLSRVGRKYIPAGEQIARVDFSELPDATVYKFSEVMRQAVARNVTRTDNMPPGTMRAVMVTDENTGMKIREWVGPDSFVKSMGRPCRRVVRINAPASRGAHRRVAPPVATNPPTALRVRRALGRIGLFRGLGSTRRRPSRSVRGTEGIRTSGPSVEAGRPRLAFVLIRQQPECAMTETRNTC
jgi:hypothetical protein